MSVHLVVVHHLGDGEVFKLAGIPYQTQIIGENLHDHCFSSAGCPDNQQVLVNLVILIGKHFLGQSASVEVIQQERQYLRVVLVNLELPEFTSSIIIAQLPDKITMGVIFGWIRQVIFKILQNSLFVTLHQIVYLFLFQFRRK